MATLSEEEFIDLDTELDENQRTLIKYLAEVYYKNPQNPWVDIKTLGAQIGGHTGTVDAKVALQGLQNLYLVAPNRDKQNHRLFAISQKGLDYVEFGKKHIRSHIFRRTFFCFQPLLL